MSEPQPRRGANLAHHLIPMLGRDPNEPGRSATPLELLYDLVFVVAIGQASSELAHFLVDDHIGLGLIGFAISVFAVFWAWINFSWFASAYDTNDWAYRGAVMVQMVGVLIVAVGIPVMFESLLEGDHVDIGTMVAGYVVMRVAMVLLWIRAAAQDHSRRHTNLTYALWISVAQVGWIILAVLSPALGVMVALFAFLSLLEVLGPIIAEQKKGGTPWHPHHIAERYGLLAIIALGEGIIGSIATLSAVVTEQGWTLAAAAVGLAGVGLTFGMWWLYFVVPSAAVLEAHRNRSFIFGYGHVVVWGAIAAVGAGLHAAASFLEGNSELSASATVLAVLTPFALFIASLVAIYGFMLRRFDPFYLVLGVATMAVMVVAYLLARNGLAMPVCLLILMTAPYVAITGYEWIGHRHTTEHLESTLAEPPAS